MAKSFYKVKYDFEAPDLLISEQVGSSITSFFQKNKVVSGEPYKKDRVLVDKRFVFPIEYLEKTTKLSDVSFDGASTETVDRITNETKEQKENLNKNLSLADKIKKESYTFKNGAILGLGIGLVSALYLKKNIFWFSLLGSAFGGYVATQIHKANQGNNLDIKVK